MEIGDVREMGGKVLFLAWVKRDDCFAVVHRKATL